MAGERLQQAVALHQAGQLEAAEALYREVLQHAPGEAHALHYLGLIALQREQFDDAADLIEQALARRPNEPAILCNLGQVRRRLGRLDEAEAAYRQAVKRAPRMFQAWHNLAVLYESRGDDAQAIECFERARSLSEGAYQGDAGYVEACRRHGLRLIEAGRSATAASLFRRACEIAPRDAGLWSALASSETLAGRPLSAMPAFDKALALAPGDAALYGNRANAWRDAGRLQAAMADYRQALALAPDDRQVRSNLLFTALSAAPDAAALAELVRRHGGRPAAGDAPPAAGGSGQARPRIGVVSADLYGHPVGWFMLGWFEHRQRQAAELIVYDCGHRSDAVSERIRAGCDGWVACAGMDDEALAQRIGADGIDLLIDLAGHTADNRLGVFARRPAARQVSFLGYAGTTGLDCFDARIADAATEPPQAGDWSSEPVLRLPGSYFCYAAPAETGDQASPPPMLKNRYVTFGCATQLGKLSDETLALWSAALAQVPRHRLWLRSMALDDPLLRKDVLARLAAAGIDSARVRLEGPKPIDAYLKGWKKVDIALDTTPFNLATQSCDALWMGVPLVTLRGDRHAGRIGAGLLQAVGLPELVAETPQQFASICARLAADGDRLGAIRAGLRAAMRSPGGLADGAGFAVRFDAALQSVLSRPAGSDAASSR